VRGVLHQRIERFEEILRCVVVAVQRFDAYHLIVNIEENGGLTQGVDIGFQPFETGDKAGKLIENLGAPVRPFFPQARSQTTKVNARSDREGRALALTDDRGTESLASYLRTLTDGQLEAIKNVLNGYECRIYQSGTHPSSARCRENSL
ncbi:transposase, partial [Salmonella enterica subsp. enterica serovar Heidelberg str. 79-0480]